MPLKQCQIDGKKGWKYGDSGKCYTGPDAKKKAIAQGIAISKDIPEEGINLADRKVSYDFDGVLTTKRGKEMLQNSLNNGEVVYVISARQSKEAITRITDKLGIPSSRVFATGSNKAKVEKVLELNIDKHIDNNRNVVDDLEGIGDLFV